MTLTNEAEPPDSYSLISTEQAWLGALLLGADVPADVRPEDLIGRGHAHLFTGIREAQGLQGAHDAVVVLEQLQRTGTLEQAGGGSYLVSLTGPDLCPNPAGAAHYAGIVRREAERRRVVQVLTRAKALIDRPDTDPRDVSAALREDLDQVPAPAPAAESGPALFRRYSAAELAGPGRPMEWLARGLLAHPTYGQLAGEMKTLKSHLAVLLALAVASGKPALDHFAVDEARPVVIYVGEGGRLPFERRLQRLAGAMGVCLADLPIHVSFETAALASERFQQTLARDLAEVKPGLVLLDPLYAFHGPDTKASDLHDEGWLLSLLSAPCTAAGASLLIVNHFNQTGSGSSLKRITQAGSGEWSDSWILVSHRLDPNVASGSFRLNLDVGSRQWGGSGWDLDLELGRYDPELEEFTGPVTWAIHRASAAREEVDRQAALVTLLANEPWRHSKESAVAVVGGKAQEVRGIWEVMVQAHQIVGLQVPKAEGDRQVRRWRYALANEPRPDEETDQTELPS